jgi:hypothetical protein
MWNDVRYDPDATDRLVRELVGTAGAIEEVLGILGGDGPVIAEDWAGPHRLTYDEERERLVTAAVAVRELVLAAAQGVVAALAAARGEQALRVRLRAELAPHACAEGRAC